MSLDTCSLLITNWQWMLILYSFTIFFYQQPDGVVTFEWTAQQQAYVLSGYFWGYAITCLVGGTAAEMWGPRKVVFITVLISALLTAICPQAARLHYLVLVAVRFLIGLAAVSKH